MTAKKSVVSVVIANFNGEDLLKKNLSKIVNLESNPKNLILEIIIVDDGSTDGSTLFIKENFPKIRLIRHKINRGVAAAYNTGVRSARGDLVLMISNDMIPQKDLAEYLIPHFENLNIFAVSFHEKGMGPERGIWKDGYLQIKDGKEGDKVQRTFYVRKGEGMYRRKLWIEIGGMDEKLLHPFYWEDMDICYRAMKHGYENLWEPRAVVEHEHLGTVGKFSKKFIERMDREHMLLFIWKNIYSLNLIRRHFSYLVVSVVNNPGYLKIVFSSLSKINIVLRQRRKEARESKVSDEAIFSRFSA